MSKGKEIIYTYEEKERWERFSTYEDWGIDEFGARQGCSSIGMQPIKYWEPVMAWDFTIEEEEK